MVLLILVFHSSQDNTLDESALEDKINNDQWSNHQYRGSYDKIRLLPARQSK